MAELLELGEEVDPRDARNRTPLMLASAKGHTGVVRLLLQGKANVNKQDRTGWTSLLIASFYKRTETAKALIEIGHANPNIPTNGGYTPLMYAGYHNNLDLIDLLVEQAHADPNLTDNYGNTAITDALCNNSLTAATLLVLHGATPPLAQHTPTSPKHRALQRGLHLRAAVLHHREQRRGAMRLCMEAKDVPGAVCGVVEGFVDRMGARAVLRALGEGLEVEEHEDEAEEGGGSKEESE